MNFLLGTLFITYTIFIGVNGKNLTLFEYFFIFSKKIPLYAGLRLHCNNLRNLSHFMRFALARGYIATASQLQQAGNLSHFLRCAQARGYIVTASQLQQAGNLSHFLRCAQARGYIVTASQLQQ